MLGLSLGTTTGAGKICLAVGGAMGCRWVTRGRLLKGWKTSLGWDLGSCASKVVDGTKVVVWGEECKPGRTGTRKHQIQYCQQNINDSVIKKRVLEEALKNRFGNLKHWSLICFQIGRVLTLNTHWNGGSTKSTPLSKTVGILYFIVGSQSTCWVVERWVFRSWMHCGVNCRMRWKNGWVSRKLGWMWGPYSLLIMT